jgi:predicted permease
MQTIWQDARYGWRMLAKSPGFTFVALLTLMLGIGSNAAIFSVVNAVLLRALPFQDPDRLVMVWEDASKVGFPHNTPSPGNFSDWKADRKIFDDVAAVATGIANLTGNGEPEQLERQQATYNLFKVLGVEPELGRVFTADEDKPGAGRVVVISHGLWKRRFGGERRIIGQTISLDGANHTVIGVMPLGFSFPFKDTALWLPIGFTAETLASRGNHYLLVVARLRQGVLLSQANAHLEVLLKSLARQYPENYSYVDRFFVEPVRDFYTLDVRRGLILLLIAVGCILLIACANLANLLLSRATGRAREIAVRTAVGASRGRLVRQLLTESVLLSIGGGLLGVLMAQWCFAFLKNLIPPELALTAQLTMDWRVLGFATGVTLASSILFGLAPAVQASRVDLHEVLKEGGRGGIGSRKRGIRDALVVAEVALSLLLLIGAALLLRSFSNLRGMDPGFRADHVLAVRVNVPESKYDQFARRSEFFDRVLERVRALPGVRNAGFTSVLPLTNKGGTNGFTVEGKPPRPGFINDACNRVISPGYMETMRIAITHGRMFEEHDGLQSPPVAIINETMARQFWPDEDPIGKRFKLGEVSDKTPWFTIVGVNRDVRQMGLDQPVKAEMSFPYWQAKDNWMVPQDLVLRMSGDPMKLAGAVRQAIWSIDRNQPVSQPASDIQTLDDLLDHEVAQRRVQATLLGALAALALVLACVGIYGVLSYLVTRRTQEIGVRLALGADGWDILRSVARRGMALTGAGIVLGTAGALALSRLISGMLYGVSASDPLVYGGASLIFALVALAACLIPARRAARIDPISALRYE